MILLTGFSPFAEFSVNPSQLIVEQLKKNLGDSVVAIPALPVSYQRCEDQVMRAIAEDKSISDVIMIGQASGRKLISLERFALNWMDSKVSDCDGAQFFESQIVEDAPMIYRTDYPLRKFTDELGEAFEISNSAGAYVCNALSYKVAHSISENKLKIRSLFIHVPLMTDMSLEKMNYEIFNLVRLVQGHWGN